MLVSRRNLIGLLNLDLELEAAAAVQYINHAAMLAEVVHWEIIEVLKAFAYDRIEHAIALADQIKSLGGIPSMSVGRVHTSDDCEKMLVYDFDDEEDAIRRYKIRIEQAAQFNEIELQKQLREILRTEQEHATYIKGQLCSRAGEREGSTIRIVGNSNFSQEWAENAAKVPVRVKKQD